MPKVTYFVKMIAKEGKAEVRETLLTNPAITGEEPGRVVFVLHRSKDDPNEFPTTKPGRARSWLTPTSRAPFLEYLETLRPLVEGESVVPNTSPFAIKGYEA